MNINPKIIVGCKKGQAKFQKELYLLLLPYLRAICSRYLWDLSYSKDILQDSFVTIFNSIDQYDESKGIFKKWAATIVINKTINFNKKLKRDRTDPFTLRVHDTADKMDIVSSMSDEDLLFILRKMPSDFFEVFNLYVIDNYTHIEIAALLNISPVVSRKRLSRSRKWLRETFINDEKTIFYLQSALN